MNHFPLLVFDWDGTLVDSIERIVTSLQHASKQATGVTISDLQAKDVIGLGLIEAIAKLHPELQTGHISSEQHSSEHPSDELVSIANAYRQHYLYDNPVPAPLFPGVHDFLDALKAQDYTLAISTGKGRAGLEQSMSEHNMTHYFTTTRCAGENKSKPHPEMLLEILDELNFSATDALMIGDSEHDLHMAVNAKMKCVGVTYGVHDAVKLQKHNPIICLDNITELSAFLNHNMA